MIILVPYPAQGHVTPMLKLASSLSTFGFRPLVVLPEFIHRLIFNKINAATKGGIVCVSIPDGLDEESKSRDFFNIEKAMEDHMPPYMERLIRKTSNNNGGENIACMVVDLLASWAFDVGTKCGVAVAGFWPAMLATYSLISSIPELVQRGLISESGLPQFHGPISFQHDQPLLKSEDLPWLIGTQAAKMARFKFWAKTMDRSRSLSNEVSESPTFWEADESCLGWLEQQEPNSVIYISFGSWVSPIGEAKVRNLALALEELRSPFVWVLGPEWRDGLPKGYIERYQRLGDQGKIVAWAPQVEVLQQKAVGCYITHCGWNSTMEAIQCKKCLLCFPVAGDQSLNCEYIVNVWKIGVKMNGFSVKDVCDGVKRVMQDREMKKRIEALNMRVMGEKASLEVKDNLLGFVKDIKRPFNALQFNI
uniref:Glycosyltransferase n=1 Tax=Chenopodium quinoa TaxID=63459 RepID=A0A803LNE3_CHEQI